MILTHVFLVDNLGMEGTLVERRPSSAVPPPWLEPKQQPYMNVFVTPHEAATAAAAAASISPLVDTNKIEEGYNLKVPPRIQINDRHDCRFCQPIQSIFLLMKTLID